MKGTAEEISNIPVLEASMKLKFLHGTYYPKKVIMQQHQMQLGFKLGTEIEDFFFFSGKWNHYQIVLQ